MCLKCLLSRLWQNITVLFSASLEFYSQCADVIIKTKLAADRGSRPEMFFKKDILEILAKLRKTTVPESFFNKVPGVRPGTPLKRSSSVGAFHLILRNF